MAIDRLDNIFDILIENQVFDIEEITSIIKQNLRYGLRPYQSEAFARLNFYINQYKNRRRPTQLLFHMATGSGKTLVMAGAILELYKLGYRNFIFFVNTDTIIRKTKENFLNPNSSKYLFNDNINIDGQDVRIIEVDNFESSNSDSINILFSTIQGLHSRLYNPQENSVTFDDFIDKKIVLISDEAHHINTLTKKKLSGIELDINRSWENTVSRIFDANSENIMLEFTATLELSHPAVASKYNSKLLFDYPLSKYRSDGYSKEVKTNQIDFEPIERALISVIVSQYKKKVFANNGLLIKPVILMKSNTTIDSALMEKKFIDKIQNLNIESVEKLKKINNKTLQSAFSYFDILGISTQSLIDELTDDFSTDKIISVNSKNDSDFKQIIINSLEDYDNEYRVVFAVDKLNEGWDVLNLFDIVRLYDTRDAKNGQPGKTTIQEAQLIGRGARYNPFIVSEDQERYKRKYDNDIKNELRICETLHYHCSHNPRYIDELNKALREIGIIPNEKVEVQLNLKEDFKATSFYRSGFILLNKKVINSIDYLTEYREPAIRKNHSFNLRTSLSQETIIFDYQQVMDSRPADRKSIEFNLTEWDHTIIKKAMNTIPFYHFNQLKRYYPKLNSIDDFINGQNYLLDVKINVTGLTQDLNDLSRKSIFEICQSTLLNISNEINTHFGDFKGTEAFYREPIKNYFRDKTLSFSLNEGEAETGKATMRHDIDPKYYINLLEKDWYAYEENFGSSEEKFLVKFLDGEMDELKKSFKEIYLLRNERFFKLFRFSDGKAIEPDFVLFLFDKDSEEQLIYQLFIEPKGNHLLKEDSWKEEFLSDIENNAKVELYQNERFRLIGMPFYNEVENKEYFSSKLHKIGKL